MVNGIMNAQVLQKYYILYQLIHFLFYICFIFYILLLQIAYWIFLFLYNDKKFLSFGYSNICFDSAYFGQFGNQNTQTKANKQKKNHTKSMQSLYVGPVAPTGN